MSSKADVEQHVLAAEDALRSIDGLAVSELLRVQGTLDAVRGALSSLVVDAPESAPEPVQAAVVDAPASQPEVEAPVEASAESEAPVEVDHADGDAVESSGQED